MIFVREMIYVNFRCMEQHEVMRNFRLRRGVNDIVALYSYRRFGTTYRPLEDETDRSLRNVGNYKRCVTSQNSEDVNTKLYRRTKISSLRCSVGYSRHGTAVR